MGLSGYLNLDCSEMYVRDGGIALETMEQNVETSADLYGCRATLCVVNVLKDVMYRYMSE